MPILSQLRMYTMLRSTRWRCSHVKSKNLASTSVQTRANKLLSSPYQRASVSETVLQSLACGTTLTVKQAKVLHSGINLLNFTELMRKTLGKVRMHFADWEGIPWQGPHLSIRTILLRSSLNQTKHDSIRIVIWISPTWYSIWWWLVLYLFRPSK